MSEDCTTVFGDYRNDSAVFIGSLLQTEGSYASSGRPAENAIRMAIKDIATANNGLPPAPGASQPRPIVLVGCNSGRSPVTAARHLVDHVQVPAIIGASFSGVTIQVATEVTIPGKVLLLSPSATSAAITHLQDDGLVWRTAPSDNLQALAVQHLVKLVEHDVRSDLSLDPASPIRLAIAHKSDSYGRGLANTVEKTVEFNGKSATDNHGDYRRLDYGDPAEPSSIAFTQTVDALVAFQPHVLLIFGTTEGVTDVFARVEADWSETMKHRPRYVFADGGVVDELWNTVGRDDDLRRRIRGTIPGTDNELFRQFRGDYEVAFGDRTGPEVFGVAGSYDATFLLGYSFAIIGALEPTGHHLAKALASMVPPGELIRSGYDWVNKGFTAIAEGSPIDFDGASGPLDFDVTTGEAPSDIQVWCLPAKDDGTAGVAQKSGLYLSATTGELAGAMSSVCE
jgi:branched-chain amino acid transport system substrate-binding protein